MCGLGTNCCCLFLSRCTPDIYDRTRAAPASSLSRPGVRCSGTELDDVHIGEGLHEDNLLDGQDVVVVTRKGDKIKGQRP